MSNQLAWIAEDGSLLLPAELRQQAGLHPGTAVAVDFRHGAVTVRSLDDAVTQAQELVARHVPAGVSLADELIRERREAAEHE